MLHTRIGDQSLKAWAYTLSIPVTFKYMSHKM